MSKKRIKRKKVKKVSKPNHWSKNFDPNELKKRQRKKNK